MKTLKAFRTEYPIISDLKAGWFLVAHPNGPAIGRCDDNPDGGFLGTLEHQHECVPDSVRNAAIEAFVKAAWPAVKPKFETILPTEEPVHGPGYLEPKISVDRGSKSIAWFDGFQIVRKFQPYTDEAEALKEAQEWFKTRTIHVPQVIYPMVRKMTVG